MAAVPFYGGESARLGVSDEGSFSGRASDSGRADFLALRDAALARELRRRGPRAAQRRLRRLVVLPPREEDAEDAEAGATVVDLGRARPAQLADVVSRALESAADAERFFQRLRARMDAAGVRPQRVEVRSAIASRHDVFLTRVLVLLTSC